MEKMSRKDRCHRKRCGRGLCTVRRCSDWRRDGRTSGSDGRDEYDLAGFAVGVCDKKDMITGEHLKEGDVLIGLASSGVHSNGFSLVRKVFDMSKESLETYHERLGCTLGEALLAPTRIYVKALKTIREAGDARSTVRWGCAYVYGNTSYSEEALYENVPRQLGMQKRRHSTPRNRAIVRSTGYLRDRRLQRRVTSRST